MKKLISLVLASAMALGSGTAALADRAPEEACLNGKLEVLPGVPLMSYDFDYAVKSGRRC